METDGHGQRAEIAARVRENCNTELGENCVCAGMIARGEMEIEEAKFLLLDLLADDNRHTVVFDDGSGLMDLLGFGLIFNVFVDGPLNMSGIDPFEGVEDAEVIDGSVEGAQPHPTPRVNFRHDGFGHSFPLFNSPKPLPGKGENAHIRKVSRGAKGGGKNKGWGGPRRFKGGN